MVPSSDAKATRKRDDILKIRSSRLWPQSYLLLKTQPWAVGPNGKIRFARLERDDLLLVYPDKGEPVRFDNFEELTEIWSVD